MTQSATEKITGLLLGGLAATGMLTAFGSTPAAQASCISAFGVGNSASCTSNSTSVAIAIGPSARAFAEGGLGVAFTVGEASTAATYSGGSIALNIGLGGIAVAGSEIYPGPKFLNMAVQLGGDYTSAYAYGASLNAAINVGGDTSYALAGDSGAGGVGNLAVGAFNTNTGVQAGPGPLAVAVGLVRSYPSFGYITKQMPGININGFRLPNTAASTPPAVATRRGIGRPEAASTAMAPRPATAAASRDR